MLYNFRWFLPGKLAGSSIPYCEEDIEFIVTQGIRAVVSLESASDSVYLLMKKKNMKIFIFPLDIDDYGDLIEPTPEEMNSLEKFFTDCVSQGFPVLVHCSGGIRRTGFIGRHLKCVFEKEDKTCQEKQVQE